MTGLECLRDANHMICRTMHVLRGPDIQLRHWLRACRQLIQPPVDAGQDACLADIECLDDQGGAVAGEGDCPQAENACAYREEVYLPLNPGRFGMSILGSVSSQSATDCPDVGYHAARFLGSIRRHPKTFSLYRYLAGMEKSGHVYPETVIRRRCGSARGGNRNSAAALKRGHCCRYGARINGVPSTLAGLN